MEYVRFTTDCNWQRILLQLINEIDIRELLFDTAWQSVMPIEHINLTFDLGEQSVRAAEAAQ